MRKRRRATTLGALALAIACLGSAFGSVSMAQALEVLPSGFRDTIAIEGLQDPTAVRFAPDGQVFVAQKNGEILHFDSIKDAEEGAEPTLFANLHEQVYEYGDRGLLGLAIDPKFDEGRPYVYALYTFDHLLGVGADKPGEYPHWRFESCVAQSEGQVDACPVSGRLVRLTDENDEAVAEKPLVEGWCQQFSSHSIGDLGFGPEGALFASGGEGANFVSPDYGQFGWPHKNQCDDPPGGEALEPPTAEGGSLRSQDALTPFDPLAPVPDQTGLSGSLIRIDPDTGEGWPGNPMAASQDPDERRIVGFGFRNPFRFAINPRTEEVYVNNVGNSDYEEIDRLPLAPETAYNSGWPCMEGPSPNPGFSGLGLNLCEKIYDEPGSTQEPFLYYAHRSGVTPEDHCPSADGSAITGSAFYEASAFPAEYENALFFADSVRGCIYVISADADGELNPLTVRPFLSDGRPYTGADIEIGPEGNLYYTSLYADENVHRVSYDAHAPVAKLTADKLWGDLPLNVSLDAGASEDPDGEALEYEWDLNGDGVFEQGGPTQAMEFETAENAKVYVRVKDPTGRTSTAQLTIYAGDTPPQVKISKPLESLTWGVGQPIQFEGSAEESGGGQIPTRDLYWRSSLLHCPGGVGACHAHPLQVFPAVEAGELTAPDHDYPSKIKIALTATDSRGLSATKTIELEPKTVALQIASDPPGIELTAGVLSGPAPFPLTAIKGGNVTLVAPQTAQIGGKTYTFEGWSDGGGRVHSLVAESAGTLTAIFAGPPRPPAGPAGGSPPPAEEAPSTLSRPTLGIHPSEKTASRTARFAFASSASGVGYACKLDSGPITPCHSPRVYRNLKPGKHVFRVFAEAPGDGVEYSPATVFRWRVLALRR